MWLPACGPDTSPVLPHTCRAADALSKLIFIASWKVVDILLKNKYFCNWGCKKIAWFWNWHKKNAEENQAKHKTFVDYWKHRCFKKVNWKRESGDAYE